MRWLRVTVKDTSKLTFPDVCPNCLQSPADTPTPVVRSAGVPFAVAFTTRGTWPFCSRCSAWITRPAKWKRWFAIGPGVALAAVALYLATQPTDRAGSVNPAALWCLLAAIIVAVGGSFVATTIHWLSPRPDKCISNFPTVRPIRGGTALLSRKTFASFDFRNPLYVEALVAANDLENLKYSDKALTTAKRRFLGRSDSKSPK